MVNIAVGDNLMQQKNRDHISLQTTHRLRRVSTCRHIWLIGQILYFFYTNLFIGWNVL